MKKSKTPLFRILTIVMLLSFVMALPMTAAAEEGYDAAIDVVDGTGTGSGWTFAAGEIWINENGSYLLQGGGTESGHRIRVKTGVTASVTLDNVNVNVRLPFDVGGTANVTMILMDDSVNTFRAGPGIRVHPDATLTITTAGQSVGNGSLSAYGGADSASSWATAGIGGSELEASGRIVIDGGTVFAKGGDGRTPGAWRGPGAAGIGGATARACGDITINGGTVTAIGGNVNPEGAGIGGGSSDPSNYNGKITINGGTVRAYSGQPSSGDSASGTGIGFCASIAIADTADVQAYSSGNYPAIYGTTAESRHSAYLLNFTLDARVLSDTDITITQIDDDTKTFEMTLPANYKNFAATVETGNDYTAALSDGSKKVVSLADESTDFPGICNLPGAELSSVNVKLKANPVCMIGETGYETLGAALAAAPASEETTIILLQNISHTSGISADARTITIDLNGYELIVSGTSTQMLKAENNGVLNICDIHEKGGSLTVTASGADSFCAWAVSGGTINVTGTFTASYPGSGDNQRIVALYAYGSTSSINFTGNATGYSAGAYAHDYAAITVTGDVTGGYYGAYAGNSGSVAITGNITATDRGLTVEYGSMADIDGDITAETGLYVNNTDAWAAPIVTVTGDVTGTGGKAIDASWAGDIEITGDVSGHTAVSGSSSASPSVTVNGDVTVGGGFGVSVFYGGTVTVNGRVLGASPYLKLDNLDIAQGDYSEVVGNYLKYSNQTVETPEPFAPNTVFVTKPEGPSATDVGITGNAAVGQTLSGNYTYNGGIGSEGNTTFRWLRITGTPPLLGQPYLVYTTNNIDGVTSDPAGPPNPVRFTVDDPTWIKKISNYHYSVGHVPGTISLEEADGDVYGPWDTTNEGGYWCVRPEIDVPAGTYTVVDSNPSSWSFNSASGYAGMTEIAGHTVIPGATAQTYTLQASDTGHSVLFEVVPEDAEGNEGTAVLSDAFGPIIAGDPIPAITDVTAATVALPASGGTSVITVSGTDLENGIKVTAFLDGQATTVTGTTAGDGSAQTATLTFPANGGDADKVYTVKASLDDGAAWADKTATVTVAKKTPPDDGTDITVSTVDGSASVGAKLKRSGKTDTVTIENQAFGTLNDTNKDIRVDTSAASTVLSAAAVDAIAAKAGGGAVTLTVAEIDAKTLSGELQALVKDRPVYGFAVKGGGSAVTSFGDGTATIRVPYTLKPGEEAHAVIVRSLVGNGLETVSGHYDATAGDVVFTVDRFGDFVIAHDPVAFADVAKGAWYYDAVSFIAAREITKGTGKGIFNPNAAITRGQVIVMLMRTYGIQPDANPTDNFSDAGDAYYTKYLAAAKRLQLANGVGNNRFEPEREISRQELFTLVYNVLKSIDGLPGNNSGKTLSHFSDANKIAVWAKAPTAALVRAGIVQGNGQKLMPTAKTKRSEMAQILYNLLTK